VQFSREQWAVGSEQWAEKKEPQINADDADQAKDRRELDRITG
jgi:hypothetical protein